MHPASHSPKAVIIGAGIAGMASAIRLAVQGYATTVFEKNDYPGGKLWWFAQDGYSFDAGPSLFTQPQYIEELFTLAGKDITPYFRYTRVPVSCHYFYESGKRLKAWCEKDRLAEEMHAQLGEDPARVIRYLDRSASAYTHIGELFLNQSLHKPGQFKAGKILEALKNVRWPYLFRSLNAYNEQAFRTPEAAQLFNRYATYNGSNPYQAPAMLSLIPHLELNEGTFYPEGGMISITRALHQLAVDLGVEFRFGTPVQRIIHRDGRALGVVAGDQELPADVVVSNMDVYFTYKHLLQDEAAAARVLKQERSSSALIFYWGIGRNFEELGLHNIFFSQDYRQEFAHIFQKGTLYTDPTVYINITAKMEAGQAPQGGENWFVMVNVPANRGQDWEALKQQARQQVIEKLSRLLKADIASLIQTERIMDPVTIESLSASYMGSLYGTSSNGPLAAFLRHPNFSRRIRDLYFVGGSVHPGGGIPLCLKSASIMDKLVSAARRAKPPASRAPHS